MSRTFNLSCPNCGRALAVTLPSSSDDINVDVFKAKAEQIIADQQRRHDVETKILRVEIEKLRAQREEAYRVLNEIRRVGGWR